MARTQKSAPVDGADTSAAAATVFRFRLGEHHLDHGDVDETGAAIGPQQVTHLALATSPRVSVRLGEVYETTDEKLAARLRREALLEEVPA